MFRFVSVLIASVLLLCFAVFPLCAEETWKVLFDATLKDWAVPKYGGDGKVEVKKDVLVIGRGDSMTGVRYRKTLRATDYELSYEARRTLGGDFFAACTFPVGKDFCTLVNGGWGGAVTGLSCVNGSDASENETSANYDYEDNVWYRFRILVTKKTIQVWIAKPDKKNTWDEKLVIDLETEGRTFSVRFEMDDYKPLGFCTWSSEGELRNVKYRKKQQ